VIKYTTGPFEYSNIPIFSFFTESAWGRHRRLIRIWQELTNLGSTTLTMRLGEDFPQVRLIDGEPFLLKKAGRKAFG
jgi:hypothetical protein